MNNINIAIGCDHAGYELKNSIVEYFSSASVQHTDFGVFDGEKVDYPLIARKVAESVANGEYCRGIVVCGSGLGVAITANKVKGIRAVTCHDTYSARMSRAHNDANILTLGGRVVGRDLALEVVKVWISSEFEGGRHLTRVNMIEG